MRKQLTLRRKEGKRKENARKKRVFKKTGTKENEGRLFSLWLI
jgi:hypothetical protein